MAGDLTIYGERENVLVIQDYDGKKTYTRVNLKSNDLFNSPVYYLSQNDVVYVEPNKTRAKNSAIGAQTGVLLSAFGSVDFGDSSWLLRLLIHQLKLKKELF